MRTHLVGPLLALVLSASMTPMASAQSAAPPADTGRASKAKGVRIDARFDLLADYDGNVFLLPSSKRNNVATPSAASVTSGRYENMDAFADVITTGRAALGLRTDGLNGRNLTLTPSVAYEFYALNAERRNLSFDLALEQDLRRDGRVRLRAGYVPTYFARNYLTDATDANLDGTIAAAERVYARGDYSEFGTQADYRLRLAKSTRAKPFGAFMSVGAGYVSRAHDAPFAARDFNGPTGMLRLQLEPRRGLEFETTYEVALLSSPVTLQVVLLDEPVYGEDLNGNGNATDLNARTVRSVDRSRSEHAIGQVMRFEPGERTDVELMVEYRWRRFSSNEPYDAANNGRRDQRLQVGVDLERRLRRGVRLLAGVRYGGQQLNRRTDLGADGAVDDYTKLQARLGLRVTH